MNNTLLLAVLCTSLAYAKDRPVMQSGTLLQMDSVECGTDQKSGKTFAGVATVKYKSGGSASASFSGLAPGQSLVLPLSGARYPGGGYQIVMGGLH